MSSGPPRPAGCYVVEAPGQLVASLTYRGPAVGVGAAFEHLTNWASVYHLEQWGALEGIYADASGAEAEELVAEVWYPLPGDVGEVEHGDEQVVVKRVPPVRVAATIHRGFPDELGGALERLLQWIGERGLERATGDHRQVYRAAPPGRPWEWEVELQIPVREAAQPSASEEAGPSAESSSQPSSEPSSGSSERSEA